MTFKMPFTRATRTRALIVGLLTLGILSVQVGRGTLAYFTTTSNSTGNTFSAGNLHFNINDNNEAGAGLTTVTSSIALTNMKPGDSVYAPITLTNVGTLDGQWGIKYVTSYDAAATGAGQGVDLTPYLQLALVAKGGGSGVVATCNNANFASGVVWAEQIDPYNAATFMGPASATPVVLVNSAATLPPTTLYSYIAADLAKPAYLPLDRAAGTHPTDLMCVQVTFPDGTPANDNVVNVANPQAVNSTINFTFDGQQRNHPKEYDQTVPTAPLSNY